MPEMEALPRQPRPPRPSRPRPLRVRPSPAQVQRSVLEEQVELWWFREPRKSLLCYCASVALVLGCSLGGIGLLSGATGPSGEWRLGAGMALCLLALAVLLKQLLSSAVQDMNCVRSRRRVELLKSGGPSDVAVFLLAGLALLICGLALVNVALVAGATPPSRTQPVYDDMFVSGVALLAAGGATLLALVGYLVANSVLDSTGSGQRLQDRVIGVFTISGQMRDRQRETTASMANLI
ncbi:transmembrane protein 125-like [Scleropages formosus]|uniref:Transmembrane protein 125-like n=1 Tax=Scleropages formosus TaxID=113540 RepID=A0A0P7V9A6_SCLFO|nr:transmembrane protein 125-like [Scleropages formosus]KPP78774.1 transmembrane protein 125-like [Scleropages formosus]